MVIKFNLNWLLEATTERTISSLDMVEKAINTTRSSGEYDSLKILRYYFFNEVKGLLMTMVH